MKVHDLKPAPGSKTPRATRRARHRRQGRQDRRPRHEGPGRARQRAPPASRVARRRSTAARPRRRASTTRSGSSTTSSTSTRSRRSTPAPRSTPACCARTAWSPSAAWSRCSAGASSPKALTVRAHGFSAARSGPSRPPAARIEVSRARGATGRPPARGNAHTNRSKLAVHPASDRRRSQPACCPACGTCSGSPTFGTRSSSRSSSSRSSGWVRTSRCRTSTSSAIKDLQHSAENTGGVVGFLDLFSGGAITNVAVFFLGIMPYITASIIMQLLGVVIPKLEEWQNEGQTGQKKITQWTRYVTVGLALVQSTGVRVRAEQGNGGLLGLVGLPGPRTSSRTSRRHAPR